MLGSGEGVGGEYREGCVVREYGGEYGGEHGGRMEGRMEAVYRAVYRGSRGVV
jgi:hypothetical protein